MAAFPIIRNMRKKKILLLVLFIDIILIAAAFFFRPVPRLLIWNIKESPLESFFYPEDQGKIHVDFERSTEEISSLAGNLGPEIREAGSDLDKAVELMRFIKKEYIDQAGLASQDMRWGSPYYLGQQIKSKAKGANCFHVAILFNSYLKALGIKSRLWSLEGFDGLGGFGHTVVEAYMPTSGRWAIFDPTFALYFTDDSGFPYSVLKLRECFLYGRRKPQVRLASPSILSKEYFEDFYKKLLTTVFLRSSADFSFKFSDPRLRWGKLYFLEPVFKKMPYYFQRAAELAFGRKEYFYHFVDGKSRSVSAQVVLARGLYSFAVFLNILVLILMPFIP